MGAFEIAERRLHEVLVPAARWSQLGFSFRSDPGVDSEEAFAELSPERNGVFLP